MGVRIHHRGYTLDHAQYSNKFSGYQPTLPFNLQGSTLHLNFLDNEEPISSTHDELPELKFTVESYRALAALPAVFLPPPPHPSWIAQISISPCSATHALEALIPTSNSETGRARTCHRNGRG